MHTLPTLDGAGDRLEWAAREFAATHSPACEEAVLAAAEGLLRSIVRRFRWSPSEVEDAEQVAALALLRALRRYDPAVGPFRPFAATSVSGALKRHRRDRSWGIRPPRRMQELYLASMRAADDLTAQLARSPRLDEIALVVNAPCEEVAAALGAGEQRALPSLDDELTRGRPAARSTAVGDEVAVRWALDQLSAEDRRLFVMRFEMDMTQSEIAAVLGFSQMHVSRRLRALLARLRAMLEPA